MHKDSKLGIVTNVGKSRLLKGIFSNIYKISDACANSFDRYIMTAQCMRTFLLLINFKFLWKKGVSEKIKARLPQHPQALQQLFSPHFFHFIQKIFSLLPILKRGQRLCIRYERFKGETTKLLPFYMTNFFIYCQVNIWRKLKNHLKNDMPKSPLYFWHKFTIIWISSHCHQISSQDFPGTLRSIFADCF